MTSMHHVGFHVLLNGWYLLNVPADGRVRTIVSSDTVREKDVGLQDVPLLTPGHSETA